MRMHLHRETRHSTLALGVGGWHPILGRQGGWLVDQTQVSTSGVPATWAQRTESAAGSLVKEEAQLARVVTRRGGAG